MKINKLQIEDFTDGFNPFTALRTIGGEGNLTNPVEFLTELGRKHPVYEGDLHELFGLPRQVTIGHIEKCYLPLSFNACQEAMSKPDIYSNTIYEAQVGTTFGQSITTMDAPDHGKYRRLFQSAFTPKMLATLKSRFEAVVNELFDAFVDKGETDLVANLALQFPFQFICDLMNLPKEHRPVFHKLAAGQTCVMFDRSHGEEAAQKLGRYLSALITERRALKSDTDFMSVIANAEVEGERLSEEVLLGFFRQLMNAGGDTSYYSFSNTMAALLSNPDQLAAIHKDRSLVPQAIEEGLRWGTPVISVDRITMQDTELAGIPIKEGSLVRAILPAANRDETIWPDPHKFDIFRPAKRNFGFGYGSHVCIGQHVARMELQVALNTLFERLPNVRLDPDKPAPVIRGMTFRGADAVHIKWDV